MIFLISFLLPALLLLIADTAGWIDLSGHPLTRLFKWLLISAWAWFLPVLSKRFLHIELNPQLLELWQILVVVILLIFILAAFARWFWRYYGPAPEGCRHCPHCRRPILKVMLECPECRKPVNFRK